VAKIAGILLVLMSFSYYAFAYGTCNSFNSDKAKCKIINIQDETCSDTPHSNGNGKSETSVHACGCVSIFMPSINNNIHGRELQKTIFSFFNLNFSAREFTQRIERPPIS
jgi:hypothetical protein